MFEDQTLSDFKAPVPLLQKIPPYSTKKKIIVIAGPTGVGKTRISLKMARVMGGEIISADSMQVYRGMDIGTAKVSQQEREGVRHHLIDSRDLDETFNVVDFYKESKQALLEIFARDHVPIVVGGTGFYIHALIYGPPEGPPPVPDVRQKLEHEMDIHGSLALYDRLRQFDPDYASTITSADRQKIIRGLEIMTLTNQKVSFFERSKEVLDQYDFRCWFLYMPKEVLYPRIEKRCEEMVAQGFLEELKRLDKEGLRYNLSASQAIGYRQGLEFLHSAQSPEDWERFLIQFKQASRRYAKRQFTWFRQEPLFRWLNLDSIDIDHAMEWIIQDYEQAF